MNYRQRKERHNRARRRGSVTIYGALFITMVMFGLAGLAIDTNYLYSERAEAQGAADAAALAGALQFIRGNASGADAKALEVAALNGYNDADLRTTVITKYAPGGDKSRYQVTVSQDEELFFFRAHPTLDAEGNIVGYTGTKPVGAVAVAQFLSPSPLAATQGPYGQEGGSTTLAAFGPYAYHSYGDPYSTKYNNDGSVNTLYESEGKFGFDYTLNVPANYNALNPTAGGRVAVEIFDPETNSNKGEGVDEIRTANPNNPTQGSTNITETRYTLYKKGKTPAGDVQIAQATYEGDPLTDGKWTLPPDFNVDTAQHGTGDYRLNVRTTDGASENGFLLRAGPPAGATLPGAEWNPLYKDNGTSFTADGKIQMNFQQSGQVRVALGDVPKQAAGKTLTVTKFDTDVNALDTIKYTYVPAGGGAEQDAPVRQADGSLSPTGKLASDDTTVADNIPIPAGYDGGTWYATYNAGKGDTSNWTMSYPDFNPRGTIRLVR